jgi:hypothetical protein
MTEHRLVPPSVNVFLNPGSQNLPRSGIKKSLDCAEHLDRPVLIAPPIRHFRIIHPNSRHDLLPIAKFDPPPWHPRATVPTLPSCENTALCSTAKSAPDGSDGSCASPRYARDARGTSAMPPIATELVLRNERSRCAMCGRLRVGKAFIHVLQAGRCSHVFGLLRGAQGRWP